MKPKRIWIAICMLLAIGIFSTDYVKKKTEGTPEASVSVSMASSDLTDGISAHDGAGKEPAGNGERVEISDTQVKKLSHPYPLAADAGNGTSSPASDTEIEDKSKEEYGHNPEPESALPQNVPSGKEGSKNPAVIRLQELDEQIARNQSRESEATTNSRKASAENEWRLWEGELQRIMGILKEKLSEEAQEALMHGQVEWMKNSEASSVGASQKQMGSAMEEVAYSQSRAELTRARAYELAKLYGEFLTE